LKKKVQYNDMEEQTENINTSFDVQKAQGVVQTSPVARKPRRNYKRFVVLLIPATIAFVLLLIYVVREIYIWKQFENYWFSKSDIIDITPISGPTANWETYENDIYNYSIKYPPDYEIELIGPNIFQEMLNKGETISGTNPPSFETVIFKDQYNNISIRLITYHPLQDIFRLNIDPPIGGACGSQFANETITDELTSIGEMKIRERAQAWDNEKYTINYCFLSKNYNLLVLKADTIRVNLDQTKNFMKQMLSTFEFIDYQVKTEECDDGLYVDNEVGFTIACPPNIKAYIYKDVPSYNADLREKMIYFCESPISPREGLGFQSRCGGGVLVWANGDGWGGRMRPRHDTKYNHRR